MMSVVAENNLALRKAPSESRETRITLLICALAIVGLFGGYAAENFGQWKDMVSPRKFRTIEPDSIYVSGQINRRLIRQVLEDHHIRVIICLLGDDLSDPDVVAERQAAADLGIERRNYVLSGDGTGDIHNYADAIADLVASVKAGKPVLMHCSSGAQRSNGATFFYRVLVQNRSPEDALAEMKRNSFDTRSNSVLIPYLNANMKEMAELLVEKSVIPKVPEPIPRISQ